MKLSPTGSGAARKLRTPAPMAASVKPGHRSRASSTSTRCEAPVRIASRHGPSPASYC